MKISGFTYVRNGFEYQYPFIASIESLLPIVDELIVVVGDSSDGTKKAILDLNENKIKIIDSIWDNSLRYGGELFAEQANIGIRHSSGDWLIHLQADEVLMEGCRADLLQQIHMGNSSEKIDGILFPFLHFWGDYNHVRNTRKTHRFEIRAFKNNRNILSYRDSQGFRKYGKKRLGEKLKVIKAKTSIFHYSYSRNPILMKKKANYFKRFWHSDKWIKRETNDDPFDFNAVDKLDLYNGPHPKFMKKVILKKDWVFNYKPSNLHLNFKYRALNIIEKITGYRLFEYKNYNLIKISKRDTN